MVHLRGKEKWQRLGATDNSQIKIIDWVPRPCIHKFEALPSGPSSVFGGMGMVVVHVTFNLSFAVVIHRRKERVILMLMQEGVVYGRRWKSRKGGYQKSVESNESVAVVGNSNHPQLVTVTTKQSSLCSALLLDISMCGWCRGR